MMGSNRDSRRQILDALRGSRRPFPEVAAPEAHRPVVPRAARGDAALATRFVAEAEKLSAQVHRADDAPDALKTVISLLEGESQISCWEMGEIPLPDLAQALIEGGVQCGAPGDEDVRVGLSGAQAGLAATGSLVLVSGPGRYRTTSLLPPIHIAVLRESQIVPDLESWLGTQRDDSFAAMRRASNIIIISGPSRTADIAMELVMGMHGPRELHIVLIP